VANNNDPCPDKCALSFGGVNSPRALAIVRRNVEVLEVNRETFQTKTRTYFSLERLEEFDASMHVSDLIEQVKLIYRSYPVNDKHRFMSISVDLDPANIVILRFRELLKGSRINLNPVEITPDGKNDTQRQFNLIYNLRMGIQEKRFVADERFGTAWRTQAARMDDAIPWRPPDVHLAAAIAVAFAHVEEAPIGWQSGRLL
jgi:hypothetical protein